MRKVQKSTRQQHTDGMKVSWRFCTTGLTPRKEKSCTKRFFMRWVLVWVPGQKARYSSGPYEFTN